MMDSLVHHFDFGTAEPIVIRQLPLWKVDGTWKPDVLALCCADLADPSNGGAVALDRLPSHLPHGVTLILGRDDVTPLFPYGVFYYREKPAELGQGRATRRGLVSLELFEVRLRPDLTPRHFEYVPGDQEVEDAPKSTSQSEDAAAQCASVVNGRTSLPLLYCRSSVPCISDRRTVHRDQGTTIHPSYWLASFPQ